MQLKGLVKIFTIALILISLFQLSFTLVVNNFEKKQASRISSELKKENPNLSGEALKLKTDDRLRIVLDSLTGKNVLNLGLAKYTYQEAKEQQLNLGLDLQGGMNVVLEVSLDDLVRNMSNNPNDPSINAAIAKANEMKANSQDDFVTLFGQAYKSLNPNGKLASLYSKSNNGDITFNSTNDEVISKIRKESKNAIQRTYKVLSTRIDKFGVAQPNLNLDENRGIISVELAGVNNPERVRKYLQATAKLEFWETYSLQELAPMLNEADKNLKSYLDGTDELSKSSTDTTQNLTTATNASDTASLSSLLKNDNTTNQTSKDSNTANLTDDQKRDNARKENPLLYYLPYGNYFKGVDEEGKPTNECRLSIIENKDTATLNRYLNTPAVKSTLPSDLKILYGPLSNDEKDKAVSVVYAIKTIKGKSTPPLDGDVIDDARADYSPVGEPEVTMSMNIQGANTWKRITNSNIGRCVAIVLDDIVYSAPRINGEIPNGRSSISGNFTAESSKDLANILETGKLPAPAKIVQEQVVGPTLGKEAVRGGTLSFLISFIVIFALMLLYYNTAGWVANIALILNLLFTVGVLASLGASLTAAGIAGLVLTIGMAVDTNVIIFERIKEELKLGKSHDVAVEEGYKRSLNPVLDGHFTVLFTAIILAIFGLGPVLGFATTQIIGIILSLFCGILVSRLITDIRMRKGKHFNYFTSFSEKLFQKFNFHFIEWRKKAYIISVIVLLLGIAAIFNGFHQGVEFLGGRSFTFQLNGNHKTSEIREKLKAEFGDYPVVKTIGTGNMINVVTSYKRSQVGDAVTAEIQEKLYNGLKNANYIDNNLSLSQFVSPQNMSSNMVSATISDDLKKGAMWATFWSLLVICIYIYLRFRKWQYALGTIIALLHDVFVILAVFSFLKNIVPFSLEIDQHFIAAVLTVIGFSMNDTVIVFDRIREYFRKKTGMSKTEIINSAINHTMSRTIMTSLTVFLTLLILFIFGGEVTRGFAFAMMIGVITGTYSSIFVAAPILVDLDKQDKLTVEEDKEKRIEELKKMA
ncbi:MAG: protein translocase subunit SecDF [Chitinophagaceae bacterium]